jgi:hypothetical protein
MSGINIIFQKKKRRRNENKQTNKNVMCSKKSADHHDASHVCSKADRHRRLSCFVARWPDEKCPGWKDAEEKFVCLASAADAIRIAIMVTHGEENKKTIAE